MDTLRHDPRRQWTLWAVPLLMLRLTDLFAATNSGEPIHLGDAFQLESRATEETRRYLVHLPKDYAFVDAAYPVLILLDGDAHFHLVSSSVDLLASTGRIPPLIVVGVTNTNRARDLLPKPSGTSGDGAAEQDSKRFLSFVADELLPEIDRRYRTRPYRLLVGHSLGGLFAVYSLMNRPALFDGYIAVSPAFGDNRALVQQMQPFLLANKDLRGDFYMTMANERGTQLGGAWALASVLQEQAPRSFRWQFVRHPEETHFSVLHRSVYDGLQAMFPGWNLGDPFALYEQGGFSAIDRHYQALSERLGYNVPVAERDFTFILNALASRGRFSEGEPIVSKALALYPESFDIHFALGRFFTAVKDDARAIVHWTRALELSPETGFARTMLTQLNVDPGKLTATIDVPAATLASYVGHYRAANVELQVTQENGALVASNGLDRHRLRPLSATTFHCVDGDKRFTFTLDRTKRVVGLVVRQSGNDLEMKRVK